MKKEFKVLLFELNACSDAKTWAGDKSWKEIYETCHRGDWLLWLFKKTNPDDLKQLTLAKAHCANTVRHIMQDKRSIKAIDTAIKFGEGLATLEELAYDSIAAYNTTIDAYNAYTAASYNAAYAAAAAYAAYAAAAAAAYAAAYNAAAAAAAAAYAAAYNAAYADTAGSANDAIKLSIENRKLTADICRKYLPIEIWNI